MSCCCLSVFIPVAIVAGFVLKYFYDQKKANTKPELNKKDYTKDVVYLFQFKRVLGLPNLSPYCTKVELFLRANKIQYEVIENNFQRSQKGLLPFIELNGEAIADSELILDHLSKHFGIKEDASKEVAAGGRGIARMFDEEVFRIHLIYKGRENSFLKILLQGVPSFAFPLLFPVARYFISRRSGGYGAFTDSELKQIYRKDLQAANDFLGDKKFFGGDKLILADFAVFGQLVSFYYLPCQTDLHSIIDEFPALKKHMASIIREYFSDFDVVKKLKE
uniref:GST C-terminal domain-containing protein n=1 Tax=Panagrolaimus sp. JU765 TaxID=591449 RepID=A0AC34PV14_9BILA